MMIQSVLAGSSPVGQGTHHPLPPEALLVFPDEGRLSPAVVYLSVLERAAFLGRLVSGKVLYAWKEFKYPASKCYNLIMTITTGT